MLGRVLVALLLTAAMLPTAQADWPSFHNDAKNAGNVFGSSYPVFQEVWWSNKTLGSAQIKASPVLKDNILITGDTLGLVRALDASSGKQLWSYKMPASIEGTPAIEGQRVYVVSKDGTLKALDLQVGTFPGQEPPAIAVGATFGSITLNQGKLFIGTEAGEMKAFLASTLTPLWTFSVASVTHSSTTTTGGVTTCTGGALSALPIRGAPAVHDGKVFFGSMNGALFAVNEAGGGEKPDGTSIPSTQTLVQWVYETGDVVLSSPAINTRANEPDRVVFTSYDGKAYSFEASPGGEGDNACYGYLHDPDWTYEVPSIKDEETGETQVSKIESSPAAAGSRVFFGANNGNVYGIESATGELLWERKAGDDKRPVTSSPAVANGIVVIGSVDKNVYWLNATDGKVLKTFATESAVLTSPAIDGSHAFIASQTGVLYNFGPEIPTRADLVVSSIQALGTSLQVTLKNQGDRAAANTTVRLFVGGTFLANVAVPPLGAGNSTSVVHASALATGSVSVKAVVDPDNMIPESNDSNNELSTALSIGVVDPGDGGGDGGGDGDGGGFKIPGPGLVPTLAVLAMALLALRKRRS